MAVAALALPSGDGRAGQERYEYDPVGRLVRYVDSGNQVTEYSYDAAGNILSVNRGGTATAALSPALSGITPSVVRLGEKKALTITGQRLQVGTLQTSDAGLDLSNLRQTPAQITADLDVALSVATGTQTLTFSNAQGSARIGLLIAPRLPVLSVEPNPVALPPDNNPHAITLRLSNADVVSHSVSLTSSDTARAVVSPASVVFAAGQTSAQVNITPKAAGFVSFTMSSATLQTATIPVFVTSDFRGVGTRYAQPVGVVVGQANPPSSGPPGSRTLASMSVGVAVGPVLTDVAPRGLSVGASRGFTISGSNMPAGVQVSLAPPDGVTVSVTSASATQISVTVAADATALPGMRRVVVTDAAGALLSFADPSRAQIHVSAGQPVIASIEPLFATPGSSIALKVRGSNLQYGLLLIAPQADLRIDSAPVVNAQGTELVAGVQVTGAAARGPRVVQVITPSGQSNAQASGANQFSIVNETGNALATLAPLVGVVVGTATTGAPASAGFAQAPAVGVVVGMAARALAPQSGVVGSTVNLIVTGAGLQAVQSATLAPQDGVTMGALVMSPDGTQLRLPLAIDANAPRGSRRVVLSTATGAVPFMQAGADQFLVVAPVAELSSVSPQVLAAGSTQMLTIRGRNLSNLQSVQFVPPSGITAPAPSSATDGDTVLRISVQVDAAAPSGPRTVIVNTAGGPSGSAAIPGNTVYVARQPGPTFDAIASPLVGVAVGTGSGPVTSARDVFAQPVGVVVGISTSPVTGTMTTMASNVGVLVGPAAIAMVPHSPDGFLRGSSGSLVVSGAGLDQIASVVVTGTAGVTVGSFAVGAAGTQLTVPVNVSDQAASGLYGLRLTTGAGTATADVVPMDPAGLIFGVGVLPTVDSVSPIVMEQGKVYTLTVRGTNLQNIYRVVGDPAPGMTFATGPSAVVWAIDSFGEKVTVPVWIDPAALIGSRVIRMLVPGGATAASATPANTITIVAPQ